MLQAAIALRQGSTVYCTPLNCLHFNRFKINQESLNVLSNQFKFILINVLNLTITHILTMTVFVEASFPYSV